MTEIFCSIQGEYISEQIMTTINSKIISANIKTCIGFEIFPLWPDMKVKLDYNIYLKLDY